MQAVNQNEYCKVGDVFYRIKNGEVIPVEIVSITYHDLGHYTYKDNLKHGFYTRNFGTSVFKTREEAERKIYEKKLIVKKRELMRNYEEELNKRFNLKNHIIIK